MRSALIGMALLAIGCAATPPHERTVADGALALRLLATPNPVSVGDTLTANFVLTNTTAAPLAVCLTGDWGFDPTAGIAGLRRVSSHLGCSEDAWTPIQHGESIEWSEHLGVLPGCNQNLHPALAKTTACPGLHTLKAYAVLFATPQRRCTRRQPCTVVRVEAHAELTVR
jgi:hypothetical protein